MSDDRYRFKDRYVPQQPELPEGFAYPQEFLDIMSTPEIINIVPWWFLGEEKELAVFWDGVLKEQCRTQVLVPFAKKDDESDLIVAFDGSDKSGDPKILLIHAYTRPGWENRGEWSTFTEWLTSAKRDAQLFRENN